MASIKQNSKDLQELLYGLERERKEAAQSGNLRQYALHLANENAVLRQMQSVAAEQLVIGAEDEVSRIHGRARHLELDGK